MNKELYIFLKLFKDGQIHSVGDIASSHHIDSEECIKKLEYLQTLDYISSEGTWAIMKESSYLQSTYAITIQGKAALDNYRSAKKKYIWTEFRLWTALITSIVSLALQLR